MTRKTIAATAAAALMLSVPLSGAFADDHHHGDIGLGILGGVVAGAAIASMAAAPPPSSPVISGINRGSRAVKASPPAMQAPPPSMMVVGAPMAPASRPES